MNLATHSRLIVCLLSCKLTLIDIIAHRFSRLGWGCRVESPRYTFKISLSLISLSLNIYIYIYIYIYHLYVCSLKGRRSVQICVILLSIKQVISVKSSTVPTYKAERKNKKSTRMVHKTWNFLTFLGTDHGTVSSSGLRLTLSILNFFDPCG